MRQKDDRAKELRRLLNAPGCLRTIWGGCAHHAQLAQLAGFKAFGLSGSKLSSWIYGLPDAGFITQTQLVDNVRLICSAVHIPVIADADTGHGNAVQTRRTVQMLIEAGAAGCFIEDQKAPKRCGFVKGKQLISIAEAAGKYRAACDIRDELNPDFVVIARTDARGAQGGGLEETIRRAKAFAATGVDMIYAEALQSRDEIRAVRAAVPDLLFRATERAIEPPLTTADKEALDLCMTSIHAANIATVAMYDFLTDLQQRGEIAMREFDARTREHPLGGLGSFDLTGFPKILELEKKYLPPEELEKYDGSLGLYDPETGRKGEIATRSRGLSASTGHVESLKNANG